MRRTILICILTITLLLGITCVSYGADENENNEENELTLEGAIENALKNCIDIELAEMDVDKAWETRETARDGYIYKMINYPNTDIPSMYAGSAAADEPFFSYLAAHGQWRISKQSLQVTKDYVALQARKYYYEIIQNEQEIESTKTELKKLESDYKIAKAKKSAGMATDVDLQSKKSEVERVKSQLDEKRAALQKKYRDFKKLIGKDREEELKLTTSVDYEEIEVPSLENKISTDLSSDNNPYLFMQKEQYEISKYTWTKGRSDEAGKIERDQKGLKYQDERKEMKNKIRDLYDNLQTLESAYNSAQESVETAREALRVSEEMYNVGMVTKNKVLESKANLKKAENGLLQTKIRYALTKEQFEKQWLAMQMDSSNNE